MTKISLSILLSLISIILFQSLTLATLTSASLSNNLQTMTEQTISQIIQWNYSDSGYFTNITVSGKHWTLPAYISLSLADCRFEDSEAADYCWKPYLVMNDSDTNNTPSFGSLYNYLDSPTLEWNQSNPIKKKNGVIMGYDGNETIGLSETTLVKSDVFLKNFSIQLGLGGGLSFTPDSFYLTSLKENNIIKDGVFYFHQDIPTNDSSFTFNLTVGSIPDNRTNIHWAERSKLNNTWELEGEYVLIAGQEVGKCDGTVYFADDGRIKMPQELWGLLVEKLPSYPGSNLYACDEKHLDSYPNLTIYTKDVAINIPARSYLDLLGGTYHEGEGVYCATLFDTLYDLNYCAVLGFNIYKDQFIAFSLDKQAIGFDLNETYLVIMITNGIELLVGAVSIIICLILAIWGNTYYHEKQIKIIEQEIADYERRHSVVSLPESDLEF